jgi:hypothetical protein
MRYTLGAHGNNSKAIHKEECRPRNDRSRERANNGVSLAGNNRAATEIVVKLWLSISIQDLEMYLKAIRKTQVGLDKSYGANSQPLCIRI